MSTSQTFAVAHRGLASIAACTVVISLGSTVAAAREMPSPEEMWRIIQQQQQEIEALKDRIGAGETQAEETAQAIEAVVESMDAGTTGAGWWDRTQIGGYGELHYNGGTKDEIDFHRYVLFFGHDFNATTRMFSEFELEHSLAGEGKPGEVELEQAYIEHDFSDNFAGRAGIMLLPVGLLNEVHEPPTFYGVERNNVEARIIPTTWWEAGVGGTMTTAGGLQFDGMVHSGLAVPENLAIRSGRKKVAEAPAKDFAATGRIRFTGIPGVELAGALQHQSDLTQGRDASGNLFVVNASVTRPMFNSMSLGLRALYAAWDIDSAEFEAAGADTKSGWYVEPSVRMTLGGPRSVGLFARYETWDEFAGDNGDDTEKSQWVVGVNFWLHPNAVLKADYTSLDEPNQDTEDRLSLGVGYQF